MMYAPHASLEFNRRLDHDLHRMAGDVRHALGDDMVALLLGGGYGRGEGAVVRRNGIEQPYNDLDLTLVVRSRDRRVTRAVESIRHRYTDLFGVEVDFSRPLTVRDVQRMPCCLMWQDLLVAHVTLAGPDNLLPNHAPITLTRPLPPIEGTRLNIRAGHERWANMEAYVADRSCREPLQSRPRRWPRSVYLNLTLGRLSLRYPRELLYPVLPRLLQAAAESGPHPRTPGGPAWAAAGARFLDLWRRFN